MASVNDKDVRDDVKEYYGKTLKTSDDLQTNVCTLASRQMPKIVKDALKMVHEEVTSKFYGCGLVIPDSLEGLHILDLGSGSGQDCFVLSKLVGEHGHVTGIDMTEEQVKVANKYIDYHTSQFGFSKPNTEFKMGEIEDLSKAGIQDNSVDIIVSNCVVNLTANKGDVLKEAYRVLRDGGEVYFSDVYADRIISEDARKSKVLWGECISGALHWKELVDLCKQTGFSGPYLVTASHIAIKDSIQELLGDAKFVSATYRLFKIARNEQPGNFEVTYKGSILESPEEFKFDVHNVFKVGSKVIQADVANVLRRSRFSKHFQISDVPQESAASTVDAYTSADPFTYSATTKSTGNGCCAKKPVSSQQESGGCCAKKPVSGQQESGGCCAKKPVSGQQENCCGSTGTGGQGKKKCC